MQRNNPPSVPSWLFTTGYLISIFLLPLTLLTALLVKNASPWVAVPIAFLATVVYINTLNMLTSRPSITGEQLQSLLRRLAPSKSSNNDNNRDTT